MGKLKNRFIEILIGMLSIFLLILQALPSVSAAPSPVETIGASAATVNEDPTEYARSDSLFEWEQGAFLVKGGTLGTLGYSLRILNEDIFKFNVKEGGDDWASFEFTVYRSAKDTDGSDEVGYPVYRLRLLCYESMIIVMHKQEAHNGTIDSPSLQVGQVGLSPDQLSEGINGQEFLKTYTAEEIASESFDLKNEANAGAKIVSEAVADMGYVFDYCAVHSSNRPFFTKDKNGYQTINLLLRTNSPHSDYFVTSYSLISRWEGKTKKPSIFQKPVKVYNNYASILRSDTRSIKQWVDNCNAAGALESELGAYPDLLARANDILNNTERKLTTFTYLENIGSSPFARKVTKTLMLPITSGVLEYHDVCNALGVNSLNTLNASVAEFVVDDVGVYHARYLSSTHAIVRTEGGKGVDYYLDCNKSFAEYYQQYVDLGAFKAEAFEYALNEMKASYPVVEGYTADTLYGLWGYVISPQENTWNHLWSEIFERPAEYKGSFKSYETRTFVNISEYYEKLREYGYNWLERVWQVWGGIWTNAAQYEVVHYLFYADPKTPEIVIGENGDVENDKGVISNDMNSIAAELVGVVKEQAIQAKEQTDNIFRIVGIIAGVLGGVALVFGGIYVYYKFIAPEVRKTRRRRR